MEITEEDFNKFKGFITKFNSNEDFELECRLCNKEFNEQYITQDVFNRILSYLTYNTENGGLGFKYTTETTLDIKNLKGNERITILGKDNVKKYWIEDKITDDMECSYISKEKLENYDIHDYGLRVGLSKETTIKKVSPFSHKTFRMKNRYSSCPTLGPLYQ